ncbi:MAG: hypothetical protein JWM19_5205, partial [Actinomycetia bacterium]|nr:hypothetical protein [Actinomycetes bacterium]
MVSGVIVSGLIVSGDMISMCLEVTPAPLMPLLHVYRLASELPSWNGW